jgi:regulatory protein
MRQSKVNHSITAWARSTFIATADELCDVLHVHCCTSIQRCADWDLALRGLARQVSSTRKTARKYPGKAKKLATEELYEYAVKSLSARAQSTGDLKAKLRLRAADTGDPDRIVERLKDSGYLNDRRYAESFATMRVENEGFGKMRVLNDLRARRVAPDLAARAVDQALGEKSETEQIDAFIDRRMASIAKPGAIDDERKLAAAYRKLRRAGFSTGPVLAALRKLAAHPEVLEDPPAEEENPEE